MRLAGVISLSRCEGMRYSASGILLGVWIDQEGSEWEAEYVDDIVPVW